MDPTSEARLQQVCPQLASKVRNLALLLADENIEIRVTQVVRSWNDQQKLYAQGRTTPGTIVTQAPPGHSWHEFGMAVDVAPFDAVGQPQWKVDDPVWGPVWQRIIRLGESLGLFSGDQFVRCSKDDPHFQLTGTFPASPNDEARQIFITAGMSAMWVEAGLT